MGNQAQCVQVLNLAATTVSFRWQSQDPPPKQYRRAAQSRPALTRLGSSWLSWLDVKQANKTKRKACSVSRNLGILTADQRCIPISGIIALHMAVGVEQVEKLAVYTRNLTKWSNISKPYPQEGYMS